jgi:hypothetical protein
VSWEQRSRARRRHPRSHLDQVAPHPNEAPNGCVQMRACIKSQSSPCVCTQAPAASRLPLSLSVSLGPRPSAAKPPVISMTLNTHNFADLFRDGIICPAPNRRRIYVSCAPRARYFGKRGAQRSVGLFVARNLRFQPESQTAPLVWFSPTKPTHTLCKAFKTFPCPRLMGSICLVCFWIHLRSWRNQPNKSVYKFQWKTKQRLVWKTIVQLMLRFVRLF